MFETLLYPQQPERERAHALLLASLIAVVGSSTLIAGAWTLDHLSIDRLGGPEGGRIEIVQISALAPPKPLAPPRAPLAPRAGAESSPSLASSSPSAERNPGREAHANSASEPPLVGDQSAAGSGAAGIPSGHCPPGGCGALGGLGHSGPGCAIPPCGQPKALLGSPPTAPAPLALSFSAMRCISCPDPDQGELRRARSSARKGSVSGRVHFCVDRRGRVERDSVSMARSFGDAGVDRVVRAALTRWRFSPSKVGAQARRACTEAPFTIHFD